MAQRRDLVLVGGGHAHVQVLRRLAMAPIDGVRTTVVLDRPVAVYSGMVPGFVAGHYAAHELSIDVRPLARRAGATVVVAAATGVDAEARRIALEGRPPLAYDVASLDVGSTVAGLGLPGVAEHALATRPIGRFVAAVDGLLARAAGRGRARLVVVGGGAGGVELAATLRARLAGAGVHETFVSLLESGPALLGPRTAAGVAARTARALAARGIAVRCGVRVESIERAEGETKHLHLAGGETLACDEVLWVAGAAPLPWLARSPLPLDDAGFVGVDPTLAVRGTVGLFAAGDCAGFDPRLPKAGVHAVREGPTLDRNLRAALAGRPLRAHRPQRDFLTLLNLGDGTALGARGGLALEGRAVLRLKDGIDRRFVRRFQVLAPDGARAPGVAAMDAMADAPCGGCAAKVGAVPLARALARLGVRRDDAVRIGLATPDDVAAVETPGGELVVASVDAFRAFTDDPWLVGRVAAVNALGDLFAKAVAPRFALAHVAVPEAEPPARAEETLYQVLAGARAAFDAAGVSLVGGHSTAAESLAVGFAVWGTAEPGVEPIRAAGLRPGDRLLLTKALGTGVLWRADMRGEAAGAWIEAAVASMLRPNEAAGRIAREVGASACTDVTGFGLAGHLAAMLRASKASARLGLDTLPLLPGALACLGRGLRSTAHAANAVAAGPLRIAAGEAERPDIAALFDPQTSGGLVFGVSPDRVADALARLHAAGDVAAAEIGEVVAAFDDGAALEAVGEAGSTPCRPAYTA